MCVVGLHTATGPCDHRWYELISPCNSEAGLSNCANKLQLRGWETRNDNCPWCNGYDLNISTHRLIGSNPTTVTPLSPVASAESSITRTDRSGSIPTLSSFTRRGSNSSSDAESAVRHREMNNRLHIYLNQSPHKVLPSASKNYPTYESWTSTSSSNTGDERPPYPAELSTYALTRRSSVKMVRRGWRKSIQFTRGMLSP